LQLRETHMIENMIGHKDTKKQLEIAITSAKERNNSIPHLLFSGAAGCGKTTMGMEMADAADVDFLPVSPDDFSDRQPVMRILDKLNHDNFDERGNRRGFIKPTIVFIDEIHRMPKRGQEIMGIAMEKFKLESGSANSYYWIPYFTIIGATTDDGELTKPFREKFKLRFLFNTYDEVEIAKIIKLHAKQQSLSITPKAARTIAQRSRGIPRTAVSFLERSRDYANFIKADIITSGAVVDNFKTLGIDSLGLTGAEIKILKTMASTRDPIGLENLAIVSDEAKKNILNTIEPYLIRKGLMLRTGKGRLITDKGREHLANTGSDKNRKVEIEPNYVRD
jgi:Holliday junction DNA helicase RuvB